MANFRQGDVVKVPFPYTDRSTRQFRPAMVITAGSLEIAHGLLWVLMITSAENRGWPGDIAISSRHGRIAGAVGRAHREDCDHRSH